MQRCHVCCEAEDMPKAILCDGCLVVWDASGSTMNLLSYVETFSMETL